MTEIKDKDLEKVGGGFERQVSNRGRAVDFDPVTGMVVYDQDNSLKSNYKPTTEDGYCENYQRASLFAENCCKGCVHFASEISGVFYCDLQ